MLYKGENEMLITNMKFFSTFNKDTLIPLIQCDDLNSDQKEEIIKDSFKYGEGKNDSYNLCYRYYSQNDEIIAEIERCFILEKNDFQYKLVSYTDDYDTTGKFYLEMFSFWNNVEENMKKDLIQSDIFLRRYFNNGFVEQLKKVTFMVKNNVGFSAEQLYFNNRENEREGARYNYLFYDEKLNHILSISHYYAKNNYKGEVVVYGVEEKYKYILDFIDKELNITISDSRHLVRF